MFDEKKFPLAVGLFSALFSFICGLLIWIVPETFLSILKPIMHATNWDVIWAPSMTFGGFLFGIVEVFIFSYVLALIFAKIYKSLK